MGARKVLSDEELARFSDKIDFAPDSQCWKWRGAMDRGGYGNFKLDGRTVRSHRVAYAVGHRRWPTRPVLHLCGCRACVNPAHLVEGTLEHMAAHGTLATGARNGARRHPERVARGADVGTSKLTPAQVRDIRQRVRAGATYAAVAERYGVHRSTVSRIANGESWA